MSSANEPVRVCVLFDGESTMRWVAEAIERMLTETDVEIGLVVVNEDAGVFSRDNRLRGKKYPAYAAYWTASKLRKRLGRGPRYDDAIPISEIAGVEAADLIHCRPVPDRGLWNELPADVVETVGARSDLVFRRGFGLLRGDILTATRFGVISYHHGDPRKYRGGPAGFWEYLHGESEAGAMVQRLRPELDAGDILAYRTIDIADCVTWGEIRSRLYWESVPLLAKSVDRILDSGEPALTFEEFGPVYHPPSASTLLRYGVAHVNSRVKARLDDG